jgi:hypothetical protein
VLFRQIIIICIIAFYLFLGYDGLFPQKTYTYDKIVDNQHNKITYIVESHAKSIIIKCKTKEATTTSEKTNELLLKTCSFKSRIDDSSYQFQRNNDTIAAEAIVNGKFMKKQYAINNALWVQDFAFDLQPFIMNAKENKIHFYSINPQNLSLDKMIAKKESIEKIHINDKDYDAQKISLSYAGLKSMLWHATAWFDTANSKLIMYKCDDSASPYVTKIASN